MTDKRLRIAFIHPDLGIGGAERLVVDAAVAMQSKGHQVAMYTSHHDPKHCFEETRDGTLPVHVYGDFLPRTILGRFYLVCAILRQLVLAMTLLYYERNSYDILFIDQLSACIPLFKLCSSSRILFYCHHPDKLLTDRKTSLKKLYRAPFDRFEEVTTAMADTIAVNSEYTASVTRQSFPTIYKALRVLYPPINFAAYDRQVDENDPAVQILASSKNTLLSINRFERKKDIELALRAFASLKNKVDDETFSKYRLMLAGGYDRRVSENVEYLEELDTLARTEFGLRTFILYPNALETPPADTHVVFLCSFNDSQRTYLLRHSTLMLYTPTNEHFGITPVEGMYTELPVIATNTGGPLETVKHEETGLLLESDPQVWGQGIKDIITGRYDAKIMGQQGRRHVQAMFSLPAFADQMQHVLDEMIKDTPASSMISLIVPMTISVLVVALLFTLYY
ncbi:hypothetical protein LRAMOSA01122 [Lichtheimia ramosa]|uniref:Alpha-1,3/1,6-mannosyltransferase ALG2 n=1 Tax=Lichtheimia ramosa TaxID=688394 RepID=A0A077W9N8_9FUNG|nr:hypothetical protein LRAMOSA01122 [Lichtheimia ramosa]